MVFPVAFQKFCICDRSSIGSGGQIRDRIRSKYEDACRAAGKSTEKPEGPARWAPAPNLAGLIRQGEEALAAAVDRGDLALFDALLAAVGDPFAEAAGRERFTFPPPQGFAEGFRTFCGT